MKNIITGLQRYFGFEIKINRLPKSGGRNAHVIPGDVSEENKKIIQTCSPYTMTSVERQAALLNAVEYVSTNNIPGSFVECGVWKGGSSLAAALKFTEMSDIRDIYMFDTFEGMSAPTDDDMDLNGKKADVLLSKEEKSSGSSIWCVAGINTVKETMRLAVSYPDEKIRLIKGKVEDTLQENSPSSISILRLDTDWYESTRYEMETLFPNLSIGGVLIIDDYGHWQGAKKAVDEYLKANGIKMLLNRADYTGRVGVKVF